MKKIPLLPKYFLWIGLVFVATSILLYLKDSAERGQGYLMKTFAIISDPPFGETTIFKMIETDIFLTVFILLSLSGLAFVAFSKRKYEDEMINSLRLYSWSWAIIAILVIEFLAALFIYGTTYLSFALFLPHLLLFLYILIFHFSLSMLNKTSAYEE